MMNAADEPIVQRQKTTAVREKDVILDFGFAFALAFCFYLGFGFYWALLLRRSSHDKK
jgi:hypothetical protein